MLGLRLPAIRGCNSKGQQTNSKPLISGILFETQSTLGPLCRMVPITGLAEGFGSGSLVSLVPESATAMLGLKLNLPTCPGQKSGREDGEEEGLRS